MVEANPPQEARPRLAARLLRIVWPGPDGWMLTADLEEEYQRYILPRRGRFGAFCWYWRQVLLSLPSAVRRRLNRRRRIARRDGRSNRLGKENTVQSLLQDLHYAWRGILHRRAVSLVVILTLALGIGAGTAIFGVVQGVVLSDLPYRGSDRLLRLMPDDLFPVNKRTALFLRENARTFEVSAWGRGLFPLSGEGEPEDARGALVLANHFGLLGAQASLGRVFQPEDGQPGAPKRVILSHRLWMRRYGSDPSIVGRSIRIADEPCEVVGVMGADYQPMEEDWLLWAVEDDDPASGEGRGMAPNARLKEGSSLADAQSELRGLATRYYAMRGRSATPDELAGMRAVPLRDWILGDSRAQLMALMAAVAIVLLIVCANVANLLLASGSARRREIGLRLALGAGRGRLIRQLLTESLLLALLGGGAGLALAAWIVHTGVAFLPAQIPRTQNIHLDAAVLVFGLVASVVSALLFGTLPALRATRNRLTADLGATARTLANPGRSWLNRALVAGEVALSVVLVTGAGLMLHSFWNLRGVNPGFDPRQVAVLRPAPPAARYPGEADVRDYYRRAAESISSLPQVRSLGQIQYLPMTPGAWWSSYRLADQPLSNGAQLPSSGIRVVTPGYFSTLRIPLLKGRDLSGQDGPEAPRVALINQSLAEASWPGQDPVGRQILLGGEGALRLTVVGVVGDIRQSDLRSAGHPEIYLPFQQQSWRRMYFAVRLDGDPRKGLVAVREAVASLDRQVPLASVALLEDIVGGTIADSRFLAFFLAGFGLLALLLGAVGVYGVMSYLVSRRVPELGLRMALGASSRRLIGSTVGRGMIPVALGVTVGLPAALLSNRLLASVLYQVGTSDPTVFASVPAVLALAALVALYFPARRAGRVDPVKVLRRS